MKPVEPSIHEGAYLVTFAKNQPPYKELPASIDSAGTVMTEWEFSAEDLEKIMSGYRLRLWLMYTGVDGADKPMIPIKMELIEGEQGYAS